MFFCNYKFNQDISSWNVKSGKYFNQMFCGAINFKQNLKNWKTDRSDPYVDLMFSKTPMVSRKTLRPDFSYNK